MLLAMSHFPSASDPAAVRRATAIGLAAVLCWSATVGLLRSVAESLGALGGAAMVYSTSALCVLAVQGWPRRAQLRQVSPIYLWGCGTLFVAYEICLSVAIGWAQDRQQALEMGLINYLWPCLTIVLAVACGQQRARWWLAPGVLLCLWGLARVTGGGEAGPQGGWWQTLAHHVQANPAAYALACGAALLWPAYTVLSRRHGGGFNAVGLFLLATGAVLWLQWAVADTAPMRWSWSVAAQVLAVGALTATGYSCWERGIQRGRLAVLAAASYFTPVFSALLGSWWLAVQPGWPFWQGVALVTAGSLLCWHATRH